MRFKKTDALGRVRLFWIKRGDLSCFGNEWQKKVIEALRLAEIPPERYEEYWFLRRD